MSNIFWAYGPGTVLIILYYYLILKYDYRIIYRYVPIIYWGTVVLLIAVWIPGIGAKINGARGWINLKLFMLQPAEIAKFSIMLMLSKLINDMEGKINNVKKVVDKTIYCVYNCKSAQKVVFMCI